MVERRLSKGEPRFDAYHPVEIPDGTMRRPDLAITPEIDYTAPVTFAAGDEAVFCLPEFVFENDDRLRHLRSLGYEPGGRQDPAGVGDFVRGEAQKWGDLIRGAGIKAE